MDEETRAFLLGAYQFLEQQQKATQQTQIVTFALRKTIRELGPEAEQIYAKHYLAESQGPLKTVGDEALQSLARLIQKLTRAN
jgi:hypothetical protein